MPEFPVSSGLRDSLRTQNAAMFEDLRRMEAIADHEWIPQMKSDGGSHSGWSHLRGVERNASKIVAAGRGAALSPGETFLLLAAILLHDVGRTIQKKDDLTCPMRRPKRCRALAKHRSKIHACLSYKLICDHWYRLGLPNEHIARHCALLAYCHTLPSPDGKRDGCPGWQEHVSGLTVKSLEPYGSLRLPLLAAILRIADETENHWTRAVDAIWAAASLDDLDKPEFGKAFRRGIEDVEFCASGRAVIYHIADMGTVYPSIERGKSRRRTGPSIVSETEKVLKAWGTKMEDIGVKLSLCLVRSGDEFYRTYKDRPDMVEPVLADDAFKVKDADAQVLDVFEVKRRLDALLLGTLEYGKYSWATMETALEPPPGVDLKWLLPIVALVREGRQYEVHTTENGCTIRLKTPAAAGAAGEAK